MDGFSYNGIHCSEFNVMYIPDASANWRDDAAFETYTKEVAWHNGGYYYGNAVKMRSMSLKCFFEEISLKTREDIRRWLRRGTRGKLVFDEMPFMYYDAIISDVVSGSRYNDTNDTYSGTFTIKFTMENPFAIMTRKSNVGTENDNAEEYCGIIASSRMPSAPSASNTSFDVYNPGTEQCGLSVKLAGSTTKEFRLFNTRNNTRCLISSLPSNSQILDINGETGNVITYVSGYESNYDNGYAYHDYGVVRLEPDRTVYNIPFTAEANGTSYNVTVTGVHLTDDMVGGYVRISNSDTIKAKIVSVNPSARTFVCGAVGSETIASSGYMDISTVNHIVIEEKNSSGNWVTPSNVSLSLIAIDYTPRIM